MFMGLKANGHDNVVVPHCDTPSGLKCRFRTVVPMTISITPSANQRMRQFLAQSPSAAGVRFGVKRTGCSGFAYVVDLAERVSDDDQTFQIDGVPVIVDTKSLPLVEGTEIDFQREGLNASFVFRNPNATGECGCGESFTVG